MRSMDGLVEGTLSTYHLQPQQRAVLSEERGFAYQGLQLPVQNGWCTFLASSESSTRMSMSS